MSDFKVKDLMEKLKNLNPEDSVYFADTEEEGDDTLFYYKIDGSGVNEKGQFSLFTLDK